MAVELFAPKNGGGETFSLSASTSNANTAIPAAAIDCATLRFYNAGTVPVFVKMGSGSQTATTTSMPLAPGAIETMRKLSSVDNIAAITASGTATVYVTPGEGM